jgi:hypothetical protein
LQQRGFQLLGFMEGATPRARMPQTRRRKVAAMILDCA